MAETATQPEGAGPAREGAAPNGGAGHPAAPVFSVATFVVVLVATFAAPPVSLALDRMVSDRFGLGGTLGAGAGSLGGFLLAAALGALAARIGRRLAAYEIGVAALLAFAATAVRVAFPRAFPGGAALAEWLTQYGTLPVVLGLLGGNALAATAAFFGSTLSYLVTGSGRLDPSMSYEGFVARSHLRLSPRTLLALFGLVVTGLVPGLLVMLGWSLWRDARERRAYRRGELYARPRMPATLLMTLISIGAVAIGVWALTVVLSVMSGFESDLKAKILGHQAHGMVLTYGQDELTDWRRTRTEVLNVKGVRGATPFLYEEVMLSSGQNLTGAIVKGIDTGTIGTVTDLPKEVEEGNLAWLADPAKIPPPGRLEAPGQDAAAPRPDRVLPGIVVGRELARALRVSVGDVVNVLAPFGDLGPAGPQPKTRPFRVAAIFYSGMYEYDSKFAYLDLGAAQRFFGTGDAVTGLEVKVHDVDAARQTMQRVLFDLGGYPFRVKDWGELNRSLFSALMMEKITMAIILGFIVLVASFTIVATLIMQVLEKRKEIAILKSMGAGVPSVMKIFVAEGVVIGAVGTAFGLLLGLGTCLLVEKVGIPLDPEVYYISNLPVLVDPVQFGLVAIAALALSYLATIYPATKAARLHPVDGLRSE